MKKQLLIGIEWANEVETEINQNINTIPFIEIIPDNFFEVNSSQEEFIKLINKNKIPVIIHSVNLSLLSMDKFKSSYFDKILSVANKFNTIHSFSDHLCMTDVAGTSVNQLTPASYNDSTFDSIKMKIQKIQERISTPFAVENISLPFVIPNQQYKETTFINNLCKETGCKLLLDLNNVYTNSVNFGENPYSYIDELNLENLDSIHLAGGFFDQNNILQDGHNQPVPTEVWELYNYTLSKVKASIPTIVERTGNNHKEGLGPIIKDMRTAVMLSEKYI